MFSKILKEKRKELNLTQQEVANELNVTRQTVSNWEVGKSYPDIPTLIELSNFYDVSLDYLLKGDEQFMNKVKMDSKLFSILKKVVYFMIVVYIVSFVTYCLEKFNLNTTIRYLIIAFTIAVILSIPNWIKLKNKK